MARRLRSAYGMLVIVGWVALGIRPVAAAEWVVVTVTGLPPKVIAAAQYEDKNGMVTLRDAKGAALGAWQKEFIAGRIPMLPEARESWTVDGIRKQVGEMEAFVAQNPVAQTEIKHLIQQFQGKSSIRRTSAQPGTHGNHLVKMDPDRWKFKLFI